MLAADSRYLTRDLTGSSRELAVTITVSLLRATHEAQSRVGGGRMVMTSHHHR